MALSAQERKILHEIKARKKAGTLTKEDINVYRKLKPKIIQEKETASIKASSNAVPIISETQSTNQGHKALVKCDDCGHEISRRASSCPNCGAPQNAQESKTEQAKQDTLQKKHEKDKEKRLKEYIAVNTKSGWTAFFFALLFGPLGYFYVGGSAGAVALIIGIFIAITFWPLMFFYWIILPFAAAAHVSDKNKQLKAKARLMTSSQ